MTSNTIPRRLNLGKWIVIEKQWRMVDLLNFTTNNNRANNKFSNCKIGCGAHERFEQKKNSY